MKKLLRSFLVAAVVLASGLLRAAIYQGIGPLDTLRDVKAKFPNAEFERRNPAWAQESDVMYNITGPGLTGTIVIKFTDSRPFWRQTASEETDPEARKSWEELANATDDDVTVDWVRWIPVEPIPLQRFVSKYGPFETRGFSDDDLEPYREWTSKGLYVALTDDEKLVTRVDHTFTTAEGCMAWKAKYGSIPDSWKARCSPKPAPVPQKKTPPGQKSKSQ